VSLRAQTDFCRSGRDASVAGGVVALALGGLLAVGLAVAPLRGAHERVPVKIEMTVNPNTDPPASLARLPRIGLTRARALVNYRRQRQRDGSVAFCEPDDLQHVTGIGPKTVEGIGPWLRFDEDMAPAPAPSEGP
jgi:hypothetical protein